MHDDLLCLPSWHHGKQRKLSWKRHGKVIEFYYQISVGTIKMMIYRLHLQFVTLRRFFYSAGLNADIEYVLSALIVAQKNGR